MSPKLNTVSKLSLCVLGVSSALAASGLTATRAAAQPETPNVAEGALEEVIVSARRRAEALTDVPLAVSVATAEQLERDQIYNINDLSRITPALEVNQTFGGEATGGGRLRGIGTGVFNRSVSPSVAYVVDQVPQGNLNFPSLFDLEQVEVLRGPQGTLFGQGASAGVINITTVAPNTEEFSFDGGIDYAPDDSLGSESLLMTVRGALNIPLSDTMALRLAGQFREDSGLQENVVTGDDTRAEFTNLRARLLWEPTENVSNDLKVEWNELDERNRQFFGYTRELSAESTIERQLACGVTFSSDYPDEFCTDFNDDTGFEASSISNTLEWDVGDFTVTSVTAWRTIEENVGNINFSRATGIGARDENLLYDSEQFTQEVRFAYTGENYDVVFGGFYNKYEFELSPLDSSLALGDPVNRTGFSLCTATGPFCLPFAPPTFIQENTENTTMAVFADATYTLNEEWQVFGGLRFTDFENESVFGQRNTINTPDPDGTLNSDETNVSGRLGARFQPNDTVTYYGSVATGYKPSAVVNNDPPLENVILDPEESVTFEIGAKFDLNGFFVEANIFHTSLDGYQVQSTTFISGPDGMGGIASELVATATNADITSYGFEITSYGNLTDNLSYNAGYIYNNATYDSGFFGDDEISPGVQRDLSGEQVTYAPEHKLTVSGEYTQQFGNMEFFLNTNFVYRSEVLLQPRDPSLYTQDSIFNVGGAVGLRSSDGKWRTSLWARNLLEERETIGFLPDPAGTSSVRSWPLPGVTTRLVGLSLDVAF